MRIRLIFFFFGSYGSGPKVDMANVRKNGTSVLKEGIRWVSDCSTPFFSSTTIRYYGEQKDEKHKWTGGKGGKNLNARVAAVSLVDYADDSNKSNNGYKVFDDATGANPEHCGDELRFRFYKKWYITITMFSGSFILAKGRAWCPKHFCCANSACARPLLGSGFVEDSTSKRNYCPRCYEVLIAPVCHKCKLPLTEVPKESDTV